MSFHKILSANGANASSCIMVKKFSIGAAIITLCSTSIVYTWLAYHLHKNAASLTAIFMAVLRSRSPFPLFEEDSDPNRKFVYADRERPFVKVEFRYNLARNCMVSLKAGMAQILLKSGNRRIHIAANFNA